jgi:hypothetical protein
MKFFDKSTARMKEMSEKRWKKLKKRFAPGLLSLERLHIGAQGGTTRPERCKQVKEVIWSPDGRKRGTQAALARAFGVHRSTICRDVAK